MPQSIEELFEQVFDKAGVPTARGDETMATQYWQVPRTKQGQIVECAYAAVQGPDGSVWVLGRNTDRSVAKCHMDHVRYYMSRMLVHDDGDYQHDPPANKRWRRVEAHEVEKMLDW